MLLFSLLIYKLNIILVSFYICMRVLILPKSILAQCHKTQSRSKLSLMQLKHLFSFLLGIVDCLVLVHLVPPFLPLSYKSSSVFSISRVGKGEVWVIGDLAWLLCYHLYWALSVDWVKEILFLVTHFLEISGCSFSDAGDSISCCSCRWSTLYAGPPGPSGGLFDDIPL